MLPIYFGEFNKEISDFNSIDKVILVQGNLEFSRRNYNVIKWLIDKVPSGYHFKIMGYGDSDMLKFFSDIDKSKCTLLIGLPDDKYFEECGTAHFIMPLIDNSFGHNYFRSKLSSSVSISFGFNLPPILFKDLADIYNLPKDFSYSNDEELLDAFTRAISLQHEDYIKICDDMKNVYDNILKKNDLNI
jgi:hypothetical protein